MKEYLEFAKRIAIYAGKEMKKHFALEEKVSYKEDHTVVTMVDKKINHYLIQKVNKTYPTHSVMGEEESTTIDSNYIWVCDPIDGTGMFTDKIPVSVFSLALVIDGIPQVGVVYDPYLDKMYTAIKGEGAYCNDKKIQVNNKHLGDLGYRLNFEMWENAQYDTLKNAGNMLDKVRISQIGSVARSCMAIASGYFSCDLFPGTTHGNCDIAASSLIVEEAGGKVTDFEGNRQRYDQTINGAIISNGISHEEVLKEIKKYKKEETKREVE